MPLTTTELRKCALCKVNKADKTNSHLFSWFLIEDSVNKQGVKGRGNELIFCYGTGGIKTYIGREQSSEEKAKPIKGRILNDDEIEDSIHNNPFSRDFLLCTQCEQNLAVLEGLVNESIFIDLRKQKVTSGKEFCSYFIKDGDLMRIFIYSLFWRASVGQFGDFHLKTEHEEVLRSLLFNCLSNTKSNLRNNILSKTSEVRSIKIKLSFFETKDINRNPNIYSLTYNPYFININELGAQLYFDGAANVYDPDPFLNDILDATGDLEMSTKDDKEIPIWIISNEKSTQIINRLYDHFATEQLKEAEVRFSHGLKELIKRDPTKSEMVLFKYNLIHADSEKIEKYTDDDIAVASSITVLQLLLSNKFK